MAGHAAEAEDVAAEEIFLSSISGPAALASDGEQSFTLKFRHWLGSFFEHRGPRPQHGQTFYDDGALVCSSIEKRYQVLRLLGKGEFSEVKLGRCLQTGRLVAIKFIDVSASAGSPDTVDYETAKIFRARREIRILSRLDHPNIVKLKEFLHLPGQLAVVLDYIEGGELFDYIQERGRLAEDTARRFMRQLVSAVSYMHASGLVHRDLKLENLLLDSHESLVITDFGFANQFASEADIFKTACGSPCYASPELVLDRSGYYGPPADVWSCGVILYSMLFGHLPFESDIKPQPGSAGQSSSDFAWTPANVYQLYSHIRKSPLRLPAGVELSSKARELLLRMLEVDPMRRIRVEEILQHPWLAAD